MSNKNDTSDIVGGSGSYKGYESVLANAAKVKAKCEELKRRLPKGISFKPQGNKYLYLQWNSPVTGGRTSKNINVPFDESGVYQAIDKAWKIKDALSKFTTASEFNEWYKREIEGKNEIVNDFKTYRQIFEELENEYWSDKNKFTNRSRSKNISNDCRTWKNEYLIIFNKFPNWDKYPSWDEIKLVLFSWKQGTRSFSRAYYKCKKIAEKSASSKTLLEQLSKIDPKQTEFKNKQSISWQEFLDWRKELLSKEITHFKEIKARKNWLWTTSMCILYALRPSEIAAALNLDKPYTKDGVTIPAINDPSNKTMLLVLGDFTYFGTSIKTGGRICKPVTTNEKIIELLQIRDINLHEYKPRKNTSPENVCQGFNRVHYIYLLRHDFPCTETYALRHLGNQLGEMYGIPQEIRARSMGHSTQQNDTTYKKRKNLKTTVDILTNHSKQPLSLDMAKDELERLGIDLEDDLVKTTLRVIYQLD